MRSAITRRADSAEFLLVTVRDGAAKAAGKYERRHFGRLRDSRMTDHANAPDRAGLTALSPP